MRGRTAKSAAHMWSEATWDAARGYTTVVPTEQAIAAARENYVHGRMTLEDFEARVGEELAREARPP